MQLYQIRYNVNVIPIFDNFVQTKVCHDYGGSPRDSSVAINEHVLLLYVDHVVQVLACLKNTQVVFVLIRVKNLIVFCIFYSAIL